MGNIQINAHRPRAMRVVAVICPVSIAVIFLATRIRRRHHISAYLLHMQTGYMIFTASTPVRNVELWTASIIAGVVILSWVTWRFVERPVHPWTKDLDGLRNKAWLAICSSDR